MGLDPAGVWGKNIADGIKDIGVVAGEEVTDTQLEQLWTVMAGEDTAQLGKSEVAPGTFKAGDPITGTPVVNIGGPVT